MTGASDVDRRRREPYALAAEAARRLAELSGEARHEVAVVLGSGWAGAADALGPPTVDIAVTDLPGFPPAAVPGHPGRIRSLSIGPRRVLVFVGRTHLYEGHGVDAAVHHVRVAAAAGCRALLLTNASGAVRRSYRPGQAVLVSDSINLTGESPLVGPRFVDLTDLYSARLRAVCREVDPGIEDGVYVQFRGPQYETPAEIGMVRAIGGDLVGMSTAIEAIAAREAGLEVAAISLVTNAAAGTTGERVSHEDVLRRGVETARSLTPLLRTLAAVTSDRGA